MAIGAWEVVLGTIGGFVTAFFAEPVKSFLSKRAEQRELQRALYRELAHLYLGWKGLIEAVDSQRVPPEEFESNLPSVTRCDCYSYAKTRPVEFYSLREATAIDVIYRNFTLVSSPALKGASDRINKAKLALAGFERAVSRGELDRTLLLRLASADHREMLAAAMPVAAA